MIRPYDRLQKGCIQETKFGYENMTRPHTTGTFINDKKTAAEPKSIAFLDKTLLSIPMRSTVVSIAELISSTISTNIRTLIINAISRPLCPNQIAIGIKRAPMAISSTKETWLVTALFNPSTEYIRL